MQLNQPLMKLKKHKQPLRLRKMKLLKVEVAIRRMTRMTRKTTRRRTTRMTKRTTKMTKRMTKRMTKKTIRKRMIRRSEISTYQSFNSLN